MSQVDDPPQPRPEETTGRTVVGLFRQRARAEAAIHDLTAAGFSPERIGVATHEAAEPAEPADGLQGAGAEAAEGAAKGALGGGMLGGFLGMLGSLLIPGAAPIFVGGVLASVLAGAGIGAATGGLLGALLALGVPEVDAEHFDSGLRSGGTLVTVDAGARTPQALEVLRRHEVDFGPSGAARFDGLG